MTPSTKWHAEAAAVTGRTTRTGRSFTNISTGKKVWFTGVEPTNEEQIEIDEYKKLEQCHNMTTNVSPNPKDDLEYDDETATVLAQFILETRSMRRWDKL